MTKALEIIIAVFLVGWTWGIASMNVIRALATGSKRKRPRKLKDALPAENLNWTDSLGYVHCGCHCLFNDPKNKKMYVRFDYSNAQSLHKVLDYSDSRLRDFSTINPVPRIEESSNLKNTEQILLNEIESCEKTEKYELAAVLKTALDELRQYYKK